MLVLRRHRDEGQEREVVAGFEAVQMSRKVGDKRIAPAYQRLAEERNPSS